MARHAAAFSDLALAEGCDLRPEVGFSWLTPRGHTDPVVQDVAPPVTLRALDQILEALGGDRERLAAKSRGAVKADFVLDPAGVHIEYDEVQHFTSARLISLGLYPASAKVVFSPSDYAAVVIAWREKGDKAFAHKQAAEFPGPHGRQRQRAYFDSFRDLVGPCFPSGPVLRIAAPENDYDDAVRRLRLLVGA